MPAFVVLDAEAVSVLAWPTDRGISARRAQAVLAEATRRGALVRIPAAVLTEAYQGSGRDVGIDRMAGRGNRVLPIDHRTARLAGSLLGRDGLDSCRVVDAIVVATAVRLGGAVVVTSDPQDIRSLAREHPNVIVHPLE